jgi:hypothetical protein
VPTVAPTTVAPSKRSPKAAKRSKTSSPTPNQAVVVTNSTPANISQPSDTSTANSADANVIPPSVIASPIVPIPSDDLSTCYPNAKKLKLQSATGEKIGAVAIEAYSYGIDVASGKSITMSQNDENPWLEIDFEALFSIEKIQMRSPWCQSSTDSCLCHLSGSTLSLFDGSTAVWTKVLDYVCDATSTLEYIVEPDVRFCSSEEVRLFWLFLFFLSRSIFHRTLR